VGFLEVKNFFVIFQSIFMIFGKQFIGAARFLAAPTNT
jgi:hypothetical protein